MPIGKAKGSAAMTANSFVSASRKSRPATSGNKNVNTRRSPVGDPLASVAGKFAATHAGPFLGKRSL